MWGMMGLHIIYRESKYIWSQIGGPCLKVLIYMYVLYITAI